MLSNARGLILRRYGMLSLLGFAIACENGATPTTPTAALVSVDRNPLNALALTVTARVADADSARVAFWEEGAAPPYTPYVQALNSSARMPVLGLKASTTYHVQVQVRGGGGSAVSDPVATETAALPAAPSRV